MRYSFGLSRH